LQQQANCLTVRWLRWGFPPISPPPPPPPVKPDINCAGWAPGFRARSLCSSALLPVSPARPNYARIFARPTCLLDGFLWESERLQKTFDLLEWACDVATRSVCLQGFKAVELARRSVATLRRHKNLRQACFRAFLDMRFVHSHWILITWSIWKHGLTK
jgi:hypothetical protein